MARDDVKDLYQQLRASCFAFVPRGEHEISEVYRLVKNQYPRLCDDRHLCCDNCSSGHDQPEWQHVVRKALQALKSTAGPVRHSGAKGYWRFH